MSETCIHILFLDIRQRRIEESLKKDYFCPTLCFGQDWLPGAEERF